MSDSFIQVPPDSTGKLLDCESLTTGSGTVQRQRTRLAGLAAAALADVIAVSGGGATYGLAVFDCNTQYATACTATALVVSVATTIATAPASPAQLHVCSVTLANNGTLDADVTLADTAAAVSMELCILAGDTVTLPLNPPLLLAVGSSLQATLNTAGGSATATVAWH